MSGRDLKNLIKQHRNSAGHIEPDPLDHKTLSKLLDKKPLVKYKSVDYDEQRSLISGTKEVGLNSLARVKKIEETNKQKKENFLMKCHTNIWTREWYRLISQYRSCEQELSNFSKLFESNSVEYIDLERVDEEDETSLMASNNQIDDLEHFAQLLDDDRVKFKVKTVCPIDDLVEDVRFYVKKRRRPGAQEQDERVSETIESVKRQQKRLLDQLEVEGFRLSQEVAEFADEMSEREITRGIPIEAFELECPNEELKISVLQEFIIIDFKYDEKLNQLNESYKSQSENGAHNSMGWTQSDHDTFQHIQEQYQTHHLNNLPPNVTPRELMIDRLKRTFKSTRRADLLKQEEWSDARRYFQQQRRLIMSEWMSAKKALVAKAEAVFAEAFEMVERERTEREEKERQRRVCEQLYEKVSWWREKKLEALEMEQKLARMERRRQAEINRWERERRDEKRLKDKQTVIEIAEYHVKLEADRQRAEDLEREKLDKLKQLLNEQSVKDRERIEYRNRRLIEKREEMASKKLAKQIEIDDKEKQMEKFFDSVKPKVQADPLRAIGFTEAALNHRGVGKNKGDGNIYTQPKPVFENHSFTDKQISSDARLRIEQRLREAGLINSEYARAVINDFGISTHQQLRRGLKADSAWDGFRLN